MNILVRPIAALVLIGSLSAAALAASSSVPTGQPAVDPQLKNATPYLLSLKVFDQCQLVQSRLMETTREAVAVARALGYDIDFDERIATILGLVEKAGPTKASMLQDVEAGRRTEIDVINGAVVRAADEVGVPVPINRALMQLIKGWETQRGLL